MLNKEGQKMVKNKEVMETTDKYLQISEIRGDTIIMKDGSLRGILKCSGLNIDLKNSEEQKIVADRYARFLNSIDFPIQIVMRSTYLDLSDYLHYVKNNVDSIENEVLKWQGEQYFDFLNKLNDSQGLLFTKEFYIVVPYYLFDDNTHMKESQFKKLMSMLSGTETAESIANKLRELQKNRKYLSQRCSMVQNGLSGLGIEVKRLDMKDIVSLLFEVYNPLSLKKQSEILIN